MSPLDNWLWLPRMPVLACELAIEGSPEPAMLPYSGAAASPLACDARWIAGRGADRDCVAAAALRALKSSSCNGRCCRREGTWDVEGWGKHVSWGHAGPGRREE